MNFTSTACPSETLPETSDGSIRRQAVSRLHESGHPALRKLECRVQNGIIELSGQVPSFYLKQLAQAVIQRAGLARGVQNGIRVE